MEQDITTALLKELASASPVRKAEALRYLKGDLPPNKKNEIDSSLLIGMTAAARFLGVSRTTLWRMIEAGIFKRIEILPNSARLRRKDLEDFVAHGGQR